MLPRTAHMAPRVHAELQAEGIVVARMRVARRRARRRVARGASRRRFPTTTQRGSRATVLVGLDFRATGPNRLWVADITYVPAAAVFLFLAVVLDACSRRIVGCAITTDLRTRLVLGALDIVVTTRRPADVVRHSDQGSRYTSVVFGFRCNEAGVRPSTGSAGEVYENAVAETFFATVGCKLLDRRRFSSQAEARLAMFGFIESFYNSTRRHSAPGYLLPIEYEARAMAENG